MFLSLFCWCAVKTFHIYFFFHSDMKSELVFNNVRQCSCWFIASFYYAMLWMSFAPQFLQSVVNLGQVCYQSEKSLKHNFDGKRHWVDLLAYCCNTAADHGSRPHCGGGCERERHCLSFKAQDLTIRQDLMNGYWQGGRQKEIWATVSQRVSAHQQPNS